VLEFKCSSLWQGVEDQDFLGFLTLASFFSRNTGISMHSKFGTLDPNVAREGVIPKHILQSYVYVCVHVFMYICMLTVFFFLLF
jgi:hypothetical protein